jgi:hypothetical protein
MSKRSGLGALAGAPEDGGDCPDQSPSRFEALDDAAAVHLVRGDRLPGRRAHSVDSEL